MHDHICLLIGLKGRSIDRIMTRRKKQSNDANSEDVLRDLKLRWVHCEEETCALYERFQEGHRKWLQTREREPSYDEEFLSQLYGDLPLSNPSDTSKSNVLPHALEMEGVLQDLKDKKSELNRILEKLYALYWEKKRSSTYRLDGSVYKSLNS